MFFFTCVFSFKVDFRYQDISSRLCCIRSLAVYYSLKHLLFYSLLICTLSCFWALMGDVFNSRPFLLLWILMMFTHLMRSNHTFSSSSDHHHHHHILFVTSLDSISDADSGEDFFLAFLFLNHEKVEKYFQVFSRDFTIRLI